MLGSRGCSTTTTTTKDNYNGKRSSEMVHLLLESPSVRFDLWTCSMAIAASMPDALASLLSRNATALLNDLSPAIREQHLDQWLAASAATCSSPEVMLMVFELLRRHRQLDLDHHSTPTTTTATPTTAAATTTTATAAPPLLSVAQLNSLLGKSIENRQVAVARELLLARADVNQPVPQMRLYLPRHMLPLMKLPFELALEISAFDMLELLLDFNADVTHSLTRAIAAYDRPPTLVPRLIKSNADVNSMAATQGGPPLLYALDEPHLVRFLIDAGADPTMLSSNGKALWEEARVLEVIEMLHNHSTSIHHSLAPSHSIDLIALDSLKATHERRQCCAGYRWSTHKQEYAPRSIKLVVELVTMIRSLEPASPLSLLPNELLFEIFDWLEAPSLTAASSLVPSSSS
mgnify:FL=1